jgi:hypothetical protein
MTASELINELQKLSPETKIVVRGYEDGYNDILQLKLVKIKRKSDSNWYEGEYEDSTDEDAVTAINLFGDNKNAKDDL